MAAKKKDPYSTQGLNDKASVQQALASAQYQPGAQLTVWGSCDGGRWEKWASAAARNEKEKLRIPLTPRRHDTLRLRLTGTGQLTLRSLSRTFAPAKGGL